jgi:murein DD-endopeptidase MepM/ murein hydrolase activator NlpD|tara:strand:+ start:2318 stop:3175 length:858 start_codon:yes stop_codon:yes gene_type:complete
MEEKEKKPLKERLLNKYRLVVLNEETYEERISYRLNKLNIFLLSAFIAVLIVLATICLIAFTSIKEYIPGYDSTILRTTAAQNIETLDSLTFVIEKNQEFINSIGAVILGETTERRSKKETSVARVDISELDFKTNLEDSLLRIIVQKEDRFNALEPASSKIKFVLFSPIYGEVTAKFDFGKKHFGTDIATSTNTPVKSVADGVIVFAEWAIETGYVVMVEHSFGLISIYKHNSSGLVTQGEIVKAGQVLALSGNTGELTTGPHLHFELWSEGNPINPEDYISFE